MATMHKKLIGGGKVMKVFPMDHEKDYPNDVRSLINLKGIEIVPATPEEFLDEDGLVKVDAKYQEGDVVIEIE